MAIAPDSTVEVLKRDGTAEQFNFTKICTAVRKALEEVHTDAEPDYIQVRSAEIAEQVTKRMSARKESGNGHGDRYLCEVESIQDTVEKVLMEIGEREVAKAYMAYRDRHAKLRKSISEDDKAIFEASRKVFRTDLQMFQHLDKYARFIDEKNRREAWVETVDRVIDFMKEVVDKKAPGVVKSEEWMKLRTSMLHVESMPSMRMVQMAGPAARREHAAIYNCCFNSTEALEDFWEGLYLSMQGCGSSFSVEEDCVSDLPKIKKQKKNYERDTLVVDDSTEGWCNAFKELMIRVYDGYDVDFDFSNVRPAGTRLKTKGGVSSGPEPLRHLLDFTRMTLLQRQGKRLAPIHAHDIHCVVGEIVHVGGVRRAARLSLSDLNDLEMRTAKMGANFPGYRHMSNNSALYEEKPTALDFMEEWLSLGRSGSGERGIFNRYSMKKQIPKRRKFISKFGTNPCGEVILRPMQMCNLSIASIAPDDDRETIMNKVCIATIFGTLQSLFTDFHYIRDDWKRNCEEERLLGVDIPGAEENPLIREDDGTFLRQLKELVLETNRNWAERLGINASAGATVVKPGGNSGQLLGRGHTVTGYPYRYMRRNVTVGANTSMAKFLIDQGLKPNIRSNEDPTNPSNYVFGFPLQAPQGAPIQAEMSAIDQLEAWLKYKQNWTEHNPSITVYIKENEWVQAGNWVYDHLDLVGGLAFYPTFNAVYNHPPYESLTEEEFLSFEETFPELQWRKFASYEVTDDTNLTKELACAGDRCEI